MFINLTNHPSAAWSVEQTNAAKEYGEIIDYPFPNVSPDMSSDDIQKLAEEIFNDIISKYSDARLTVHVMGEFTMAYALIQLFKDAGITCVASTTERIVTETEPGKKNVEFHFVKLREY